MRPASEFEASDAGLMAYLKQMSPHELERFAAYFKETQRALDSTQSPIERQFLDALFMDEDGIHPVTPEFPKDRLPERGTLAGFGDKLMVLTQAPFGRYTFDFLFVTEDETMVVECDGHDFHERTKAQAAKDRKRDRVMASHDVRVLRFTGSEIHRDAAGCAREALRIFRREAA